MIPLLTTLTVLLIASLAEWLHTRRIRAVGRLAFGPTSRPHAWTRMVPLLRSVAFAAFTWGLVTLFLLKLAEREGGDRNQSNKDATRLMFVADLSPSMYLADAGPEGKLTRHARMREVVEGILQRVSGNLRYGVIGFWTESQPVVMEARDPELVRNVFNGLPLSYAMRDGPTDLGKAINEAVKLVADFPEGSTRLIIATDGDCVSLAPIAPRPKSVKEIFVLGVGNSHKGTFIDGHLSRQEGDTLRTVASALMGTYVDVNEKHLTTEALGDLVVTTAPPQRGWTREELAVLAMVLGAAVLALLPVALEYFGSDWKAIHPERDEAGAARTKEGALATR